MKTDLGALLTQLIGTITHWARLFASLFLIVIVCVALADLLGLRTPYIRVDSSGQTLAWLIAAAAFALKG